MSKRDGDGILIGLALAAVISAFRRKPEPPALAPRVERHTTVYRDRYYDDDLGSFLCGLFVIISFIVVLFLGIFWITDTDSGYTPSRNYYSTQRVLNGRHIDCSVYADSPDGISRERIRECISAMYASEIIYDPAPVQEYEEGRDITFTTPWKLSERKVEDEGDEWTAATVSCIYLPPEGKRQTFRTESGVHNVPESQTIEGVTKCPETIDDFYYEGGYYTK